MLYYEINIINYLSNYFYYNYMNNKNIIFLIIIGIVSYLFIYGCNKIYKLESKIKKEKFIEVDDYDVNALRKEIIKIYKTDVEAINNISKIAEDIVTNNKIKAPSNFEVGGNMVIKGRINTTGSVNIDTSDNLALTTSKNLEVGNIVSSNITSNGNMTANNGSISDRYGSIQSAIGLANTARSEASQAYTNATNYTDTKIGDVKRIEISNAYNKGVEGVNNAGIAHGRINKLEKILQRGIIFIWSGSKDNIPYGWVLCDGNNGTPDLRDRFVLGGGGKYNVNSTGGEENVTLTINQMPSHSHDIHTGSGSGSTPPGRVTQWAQRDYWGIKNDVITPTGGSQPHNNMPPYFVLCYIMKI